MTAGDVFVARGAFGSGARDSIAATCGGESAQASTAEQAAARADVFGEVLDVVARAILAPVVTTKPEAIAAPKTCLFFIHRLYAALADPLLV